MRKQTSGDIDANAALLKILVGDVRNLILEMRREDKTWNEISVAAGLPGFVCMNIAGETAKHRMTPDRQSGR